MIAQLSTNGKQLSVLRQDCIKFQYNPSFTSYIYDSKDELKKNFKINRSAWILEEGLDSLIKRLDEGLTVQAGINTTSTLNKDIESIDWFYIDYDAWNKLLNKPIDDVATIEEILALSFVSEYCCLWQKSFSYREEAPNLHLLFLLSRTVTVLEQKIIIKCFAEHLKDEFGRSGFDPSIENNPGQVMFAGKEVCYVLNKDVVVDVDSWLELATELGYRAEIEAKENRKESDSSQKFGQNKSHAKPPESSEKEEAEEVVETFTEKLFKRIQTEIVEGVLEGDVKGLYCLFEHKWIKSTRALNGAIAQWDGYNPFSDSNSSGESFTITRKYANVPPQFYDRSGNFKGLCGDGLERTGGSIIDYWFSLGNDSGGNRFWSDEDEKTKSVKDKQAECKLRFTDVCTSLFAHFGLKYRNNRGAVGSSKKSKFEQDLKTIVEDCRETFKGKIFYYGERLYFLWASELRKWSVQEGLHYPYGLVFSKYISEKYGHFMSENGKVKDAVMGAFKNGNTIESLPNEDMNYQAFQNGILHKITKEFKHESSEAYNRYTLPYDFDFNTVPSDDNPIIEKFKKYWGRWINSEVKGQILLDWLILCVQFRAWESEKILGVIGASGKGKTLYCTLINSLINGCIKQCDKYVANPSGYGTKPDTDRIMSTYSHATAVLEGKMHVHIEELKGGHGSNAPNILKRLSGNSANRTLTINPKGQKERDVPFYASITFDCEKMIQIPNEQGYFRRIVFVIVGDDANKPNEDIDLFYNNLELILHWCVMQDGTEVLKRFLKNTKDDVLQDDVKDIRFENDAMAQFIYDNYELTDNPEDIVPLESIYLFYSTIRKVKGYGGNYENQKNFGLTFKNRLKDAGLGFKWQGTAIQKGKTKKTYYTNLKRLVEDSKQF